ncbi:MAG TPA: 4-carboxy-4-hydroxy-2-oxoadipate aldolase/oxaloacetate decarboxylase [Caldilineaceae bacterium]|nr:4-carboxy-4-hydroxy-2-oxoadipate aldolase/oxaloacetate decarboxylase [Caldilineaceae bacterium]
MAQFNTDFTRMPGDLLAAFASQETATVYEASDRMGAMSHRMRPIGPGFKLCGSALTVRCQAADNLTLHAAIALAQPGDVIVADVGEALEAGYWGEVTTVAAQSRGVGGLVINGGVRDVAAIRARGFPIFSASISMKATVKATPGFINHPILCGGVLVRPGDLVLGDDDGVVVIAQEKAASVLAGAQARMEKEAEVMDRLQNGELTLDLLGFRDILAERGIHL